MVEFQKIRFKNFKSYGNQFTEVILNKSPTTAITAANGMGKSTILHAIEFGLFGKVSVGINKPDLINNINGKDCIVEVEFVAKNRKFLIRRGMRPGIFEIFDGETLLNQDASSRDYQQFLEEEILGFGLNTFKQIVTISGSSFTPFMLLPTGIRRKITDNILDLYVISVMNRLMKIDMDNHASKLRDVESAISACENRIKGLKEGLRRINERSNAEVELIDQDIARVLSDVERLNSEVAGFNEQLEAKANVESKSDEIERQLGQLDGFRRDIKNQVKSITTQISNIESLTDCPTCHREIDDDFKLEFSNKGRAKIHTREHALSKLEQKYVKLEQALQDVRDSMAKFADLEREIITRNARITELNRVLQGLNKKRSAGSQTDSDLENQIKEVDDVLQGLKRKRLDLLVETQYNDLVLAVIKDTGIRASIIKKYIPKINATLNQFLELLDLNVSFTFDENFNERILSRFRDDLSYSSFSAGERARIDIALLLTWREIARSKNSLRCNLLFLDETFDAYLDSAGLEAFVNLLTNHLEGTNVFMISHRPEIVDKFHSNLRITKIGNFSRIDQ